MIKRFGYCVTSADWKESRAVDVKAECLQDADDAVTKMFDGWFVRRNAKGGLPNSEPFQTIEA